MTDAERRKLARQMAKAMLAQVKAEDRVSLEQARAWRGARSALAQDHHRKPINRQAAKDISH